MAQKQYIPQLDGLRAIAILLVLYGHSQDKLQSIHLDSIGRRGWIGVDLFFVLSGFLITGILLDTKGRPGWLKNFYARRTLRIWPLYYALLAFLFFVMPHIYPKPLPPGVHAFWYWLYIQNWFFRDSWGYGPLTISWSLAIEEQFYLAWPITVWALSRKNLTRLLVGVLVLCPVLRLAAYLAHFENVFRYTFTLFRLDGIAAGALLAIWVRSESFSMARLRRFSVVAFAAGSILAVINFATKPADQSPDSVVVFSFLALAFVGALGLSLASKGSFLENRALRYIGKVSYGIYLLHITVFGAVDLLPYLKTHPLADVLVRHIVLLAVVTVSWYAFESPILRLKRLFETPPASKTLASPRPVQAAAYGVGRVS